MKADKSTLIAVAKGAETETIPVWIPEPLLPGVSTWRLDHEIYDGFDNMFPDTGLVIKYARETIDLLKPDAVCLFTDAWIVAAALGVQYKTGHHLEPVFDHATNGKEVILSRPFNEKAFTQTFENIAAAKKEIDGKTPLVVKMMAPWTLFSRMNQTNIPGNERLLLYKQPAATSELMESLADASAQFIQGIVQAGADVVYIQDNEAGRLNLQLYQEYGIPGLEAICNATYQITKIIDSGGAYQSREELAKLNCQVISLGWNMHIKESRQIIGPFKTLQGNLDPVVLLSGNEVLKRNTERMLRYFGPFRHIASPGGPLLGNTSIDAIRAFFKTVRHFRHSEY